MDNRGRLRTLLGSPLDPLRIAVMTSLTLRPATATELADELGSPVERVRYQLKQLRQAGLVGIRGQVERRGAVEHIYIAKSRQGIYTRNDLLEFPNWKQQKYGLSFLRVIFNEALEAARGGAFEGHDDYSVVRVPLRLDREGFDEISAIFESALRRLLDIREECLARMEETGEEPTSATSILLLFET